MLSALLPHVLLLLASDSTRLCVGDAATGAPLSGVHITTDTSRRSHAGAHAAPIVQRFIGACGSVRVGQVLLRRVGYQARQIEIPVSALTIRVSLDPIGRVAQILPLQQTVARQEDRGSATGHTSARQTVTSAREAGVGSMNALIASMPYTLTRSARNETGLSLRGVRREQVAITIDGMSLNDPAMGVADVSDMPLAGIGAATVVLGADPLGVGPGATGGVLALESTPERLLALRLGAFGEQSVEGAVHGGSAQPVWHASAAWFRAVNNFAFENTATVNTASRERRVNNDEQRVALSAGAVGLHWQLWTLASLAERGMVGAENVHAYDEDRARTGRFLLRLQSTMRGAQLVTGVRAFALEYRDPTRPVLNAEARSMASDLELRGLARALTWRVGAGMDGVRASGGIRQSRSRGFGVLGYARQRPAGAFDVGVRVDAVSSYGALPSLAIGGERVVASSSRGTRVVLVGRVAQAVRVPTLYDLYFASPQRLFVRTLTAERVTVDAEIGAQIARPTPLGNVSLTSSVVARNIRDAIVWFPGNFGWSPANVGRERMHGVEGRLVVRPSWGTFSTWITAYDTELTTGALHIPTPYVPRVAGGVQSVRSMRALTASGFLRVTGRRPFSAGPRDPAYELPAVALLDLAISRQARLSGRDMLVAASLENVTDARWQSVRGFPAPGRGWALSITFTHHTNP